MRFGNVVLGMVGVALLSGCALVDRKQVDYKAGAAQAQALEIPPDLTVPEGEQRYAMPGKDGEKVASYSEYAKRQPVEQPCVAPAVPAPAAAAPAAQPTHVAPQLREADGSKTIVLGEPFDRSWRQIGLAIERAKIMVTDRDRSKGIYFIAVVLDKKMTELQVTVRETTAGSEAMAVDAAGKQDTAAIKVTELLFQNLEK